ncbi:phosphotransferase family protein [Nocardioides sp. AE5]|uniref:phosphotransferase family protein n=1 Tax=Nocardioides sp. AE5 TaxID=2962573 RepID=UPI00288189CA|nr:phosphotransferase family protein [Nocardioides sp. AE5]MDT0202692.1 phosphotransferase family protein [Nocardioides sp. AE5]
MAAESGNMTADVAPVRAGEELPWDRLEAYLREHLPGLSGDLSVLQFPRGSANLTYRVTVGETHLVVRRPPFGKLAKGSHDMEREHRVLSRLHRVYDRAPRAFLHCADPAVIGAEFFVSEYREGVVVWDHVPATVSADADAAQRVGLSVIDALVDLHAVDPEACGLAELGRPEGYLERQLAGWQRRWDAVQDYSDLPDAAETNRIVREVAHRLTGGRPGSQRPGIVHNDYKVDNCQFAPGDPDRVHSVFDWDMATTGDVLADFGTLLNYWPEHGLDAADPRAFIAASANRALDLPSRAEAIERYATRSALDLADIAWYEAFGCWKTVVILQQLYARAVRGESTDPRMLQRGEMVGPLARRALLTVGGEA